MSLPISIPAPVAEDAANPLRLFDPSVAAPPSQSIGPDLRTAYVDHVLPNLIAEGIKKRTLEEDRSAIRKWETRTGNPGVLSPRSLLCDEAKKLRSSLLADGLAPDTIRKTFRHLRKIWRRLAHETSRNPGGCGLIRRAPTMPPVKLERKRKSKRRIVPIEKVAALFEGCQSAKRLRPLRGRTDLFSPDVWRAALVVDHFYGPRTRDLFSLRAEHVILSPPHPDGEMPFAWPHGWLCYETEKTGVEVIVPLHPIVRSHLAVVLPRALELDAFLFPVPRTKRAFYEHWLRIKSASQAFFHFQEVRKTANTSWNRLWPGLGKFVLGHRPEGVNETYYNDCTQKCMDLLPSFHFPDCFREVRAQQKLLFA